MNVFGSQGLARVFIGWQHTAGSRCATDQESTVENRQATEMAVAAPGLPENYLWSAKQYFFK